MLAISISLFLSTASLCKVEYVTKEYSHFPAQLARLRNIHISALTNVLRRVRNGDTGDLACDHYSLFEQDIQIMKVSSSIFINEFRERVCP